MLIQIILSLVEDCIISFFIASMTNIKNRKSFIIINTSVCVLLTTVFNLYNSISNFLPIFFSLAIIALLKIFKKKITLNDIIACLLGSVLIIVTDLIALSLYSFFINLDLSVLISNQNHIIIASFLAKILLFVSCRFIISINPNTRNNLSYKKWILLFPIWFLLFSSIYVLGNSIVSNSMPSYFIYYQMFCLILLSILIAFLYHIIQKESLNAAQIELNIQKEKYIKQNKSMILKLHDEISVIDHNNMYALLQVRNLLKDKKYEDIDKILENKILSLRKYKNIVYTGSSFLDQMLNKQINYYSLLKRDVKTICLISNDDIDIQKKEIDFIINIIKYLFSISKSDKTFSIEISDKLNYLTFSFIFFQEKNIDEKIVDDLYEMCFSNMIKYHHTADANFTYFKIIVEIK